MDKQEWINEWFSGFRFSDSPMTVKEAEDHLGLIRDFGYEVPEDMTVEEFAKIWNSKCKKWRA